jgi:hypothetical protein
METSSNVLQILNNLLENGRKNADGLSSKKADTVGVCQGMHTADFP